MLNKILRKLKSGSWFPFYNSFYEHLHVDSGIILLESRSGKGLESNIFAIFQELNKETYGGYRLYLAVNKSAKAAVMRKIEQYGLRADGIVQTGSIQYYYYLAKAGFLVNDTTFPGRFVKKKGQVYLNTSHCTPLKAMGRDNASEVMLMGNVLRNLLASDYLLFPNYYMQEKMISAYMLDNLYQGEILQEGYPRNAVFFDKKRRQQVRQELELEGKTAYIYMPTYRGRSDKVEEERYYRLLRQFFDAWDKMLGEDEILMVKLHPFLRQGMALEGYAHLRAFPDNYDTYDVLNICEGLITDYSSVFYDYANTGGKVILFAYDYEEYNADRGTYEDIHNYPFPVVTTAREVVEQLHSGRGVADIDFAARYDTWDNAQATVKVCRHVFLGEKICHTVRLEGNGRENVLLYPGDLDQNGITTVFCNTVELLDKDKYNYFVSFRMNSLKTYPERLKRLPDGVGVYPIASEMSMDVLTGLAHFCYLGLGISGGWVANRLDKAYVREWRKHFGNTPFRHVIQYNGYEAYMIMLMLRASSRKSIWVHNDMVQEIARKKNQNRHLLREAYPEYDYVVAVSEDVANSVREIAGDCENLIVIENPQDYHRIRRRAQLAIQFDEETQSTVSLEQLKDIMAQPGRKFMNMGRYSPEKGHGRLIDAFAEYYQEHHDSWLIIIGGTGNLYEQTVQKAAGVAASAHIVLIKSMSNPMPVLKDCDLFLLTSHYEGQPLVLMEADILGVPVAGCRVSGIQEFMKKYKGKLLEDSREGILEGMMEFDRKPFPLLEINHEERNRRCRQQVEELL